MNTSFGREFEENARANADYSDDDLAGEVARDDLRLNHAKRSLSEASLQSLRGEIQKGIDQLENGESVDGETVMAELRTMLVSRRAAKDG